MALSRKQKKKPPRRGRESWRVATLVRHAISARDDDVSWKCISALHWKGDREVLNAAVALCKSNKAKERRIGADILGQLGVPDRTFPEEALKILHGMLRTDSNPDVLNAVLVAIGHTQDNEDMCGIQKIVSLRHHRNSYVRYGVVHAIAGREDGESVNTLIKLMEDSDTEVRDWATFGLGTQLDLDTPRIRKALWKRVNDSDLETRCEAIVGLARRKDSKIRDVLVKELSQEKPSSLVFDATANYGDPHLMVHLKRHLRTVKRKNDVNVIWYGALKRAVKDLRQRSR